MYTVSATNDYGELVVNKSYKTPWNAISAWLREGRKYPLCVAIDATTKDEVVELRRTVNRFKEWFLEEHTKYKNGYKADWLLDQVKEPEKLDGCEFKHDDVPSYPCVPFTVG